MLLMRVQKAQSGESSNGANVQGCGLTQVHHHRNEQEIDISSEKCHFQGQKIEKMNTSKGLDQQVFPVQMVREKFWQTRKQSPFLRNAYIIYTSERRKKSRKLEAKKKNIAAFFFAREAKFVQLLPKIFGQKTVPGIFRCFHLRKKWRV